MKKIVLVVATVFITQFGFSQQTDESLKKDVLKVIEVSKSGTIGFIDKMRDQIVAMIPKEKQAAFIVEFNSTLPALYDKMAEVYMEIYTKEEIAAMLAYYESPMGKQINAKMDKVVEKTMEAGQEWGLDLQGMMMKYMEE